MTHSGGKPHNVGDQGQRFQIKAKGYPKEGWNVIGWTDDLKGAIAMAEAIEKAPSCLGTRIKDRVGRRTL